MSTKWSTGKYGWYGEFLGEFKESDHFGHFSDQELKGLAEIAADLVYRIQLQPCDATYMELDQSTGRGEEIVCQLPKGHDGTHYHETGRR
jgi:hypothetical protein